VGVRRYYKHLNLLWFDRDADLNTPASTPSGRIDGMVVAHIIGKGAPETGTLWSEAPLVREPDVTLYGIERLDPPEQEFLGKSPMRHILAAGTFNRRAVAERHTMRLRKCTRRRANSFSTSISMSSLWKNFPR